MHVEKLKKQKIIIIVKNTGVQKDVEKKCGL